MEILTSLKSNLSANILNLFILIIIISDCIAERCTDRNNPYLVNDNYCSNVCESGNSCQIDNEIIKTQFINNLIYLDEVGFVYSSIVISEKNNLYLLSSQYPETNQRILYLLNHEGYGLLRNDDPFENMTIDDPDEVGRFESEIFTFKLENSNDDKEYLISIPKSIQNIEIYEFDNRRIFFDLLENVLGPFYYSFTIVGVHLKLKSAEIENKNVYLIGILAYDDEEGSTPYFYLKKVRFTSLDIKNNRPNCYTQKTQCSLSKIISCYETNKYYIICFYQNNNFDYTMIVYNSNLEEKNKMKIADGYSGEGYEDFFLKCIHFFNETGAFAYFTSGTSSSIAFQFKRYFDNNNTIVNQYNSLQQILITNYEIDRSKVSLCDMIKVEDKKLYFVGTNDEGRILIIISLFNFHGENFAKRVYVFKTEVLFNFRIYERIRLGLYNNFLSMGLPSMNTVNWKIYSSLLIFSYVKSNDTQLNLITYMYNNDVKINNLEFELEGKYIIENNVFGYVYSGVEIIQNCIDLEEDIYLTDLNNSKIVSNYFVPKNEKIKLKILPKETYEAFICNFQYASVVTEPDYSEYNNYPVEFEFIGQTEEDFFEDSKRNYVGRYSYYKLISGHELRIDCPENCELCYSDNSINVCVTCKYDYYFDNKLKVCKDKPPETEITESERITQTAETEGVTEKTETEGVTEKTETEGNTEMANTEGNTEMTETEGNTQMTETERNTEMTKTDEITELGENKETTDKSTNKISENNDTDEATTNNNQNENGIDTSSITNKISENYDTDKVTENNGQSERNTDISSVTNKISENLETDEKSENSFKTDETDRTESTDHYVETEKNNLSETSETDKNTNSDIVTETDILSDKDSSKISDEFTHKETNTITDGIKECSFDEIIDNKCDREITNNQINEVYTHILNTSIKNNNSTVIKTDNTIFQVTKIELQKESNDPEISNIDLGYCETLLKRNNNISDNESLIIFKIDMKQIEQYSTYVQYEIYHPNTLQKLNLNVCNDVTINIYPPVHLDEQTLSIFSDLEKSGYNLFNSSGSFYNDFCTPYTTKNGTDMILGDRQKEIYGKSGNKALCQNGCELEYFNQTTSKAKCNCVIQKSNANLDITDLESGKNILEESFINTLSNSNFQILRCYKLAIDLSAIFENIGRIIMTVLLFLILVLFVLHCIFGYKQLFKILTDIIKRKSNRSDDKNQKKHCHFSNSKVDQIKQSKPEKKEKPSINNKKRKNNFKKNTNKTNKRVAFNTNTLINAEENVQHTEHNKKGKKRLIIHNHSNDANSKETFYNKKKQTTKINNLSKFGRKANKNKTYNVTNKCCPPKKKLHITPEHKNSSLEGIHKTSQNIIISKNVIIKMNQKKRSTSIKRNNKKSLTSIKNKNKKMMKKLKSADNLDNKEIKEFHDFTYQELNNMLYKEALIYDKRTYIQYYWCLIKKKQLIFFTFINDEFNLVIIKIALFLLSFSLYITVNGFFFSDETMHAIYKTNGIYNLISQIPKIFYSTMVTAAVNMILKYLSLSESNMLQIKKEESLVKARKMSERIWFLLKIKTSLFFIISILLMLFFWYYISCFCAVYKNTQNILIKDTLYSFCLSMIYPFGLNLIPGIFRIYALRSPKKNKECLYKASTVIALI